MRIYFVERRTGEYLAKRPIVSGSYTNDLRKAEQFSSYEAAKKECCENEHVFTFGD